MHVSKFVVFFFVFFTVTVDDCKKCNSKYTVCFRGKCVCKPGFVGDGKYCIPILKGNFELHICLLNIFLISLLHKV